MEYVRFMKPGDSHATIFFCSMALTCVTCYGENAVFLGKMRPEMSDQRKNAAKIDYLGSPKIQRISGFILGVFGNTRECVQFSLRRCRADYNTN